MPGPPLPAAPDEGPPRSVVPLDRLATHPRPAGWTEHRGFDLPTTPWSLARRRVVCVGVVADAEDAAAALQAHARGAGLLVALTLGPSARLTFLDDLARVAPAAEASAGGIDAETGLTPVDLALLDALAAGETVAQAARSCHVSVRTAHRRLAAIRAHFDVAATAAAVAAHVSSGSPRRGEPDDPVGSGGT